MMVLLANRGGWFLRASHRTVLCQDKMPSQNGAGTSLNANSAGCASAFGGSYAISHIIDMCGNAPVLCIFAQFSITCNCTIFFFIFPLVLLLFSILLWWEDVDVPYWRNNNHQKIISKWNMIAEYSIVKPTCTERVYRTMYICVRFGSWTNHSSTDQMPSFLDQQNDRCQCTLFLSAFRWLCIALMYQ